MKTNSSNLPVSFSTFPTTFLLLSLFSAFTCFGQNGDATVKEYLKEFKTYPFSDPNPIPLQGAVYPYFRFDGFTDQPVNKKWKVVELENDFIQVMILPEIGGKIWAAIEKSTQQPFIYYNHTVKFRDIAMRGPWTSGGLEANYGIIGHTPNCATPVDYVTTKNADGSVSCTIGVFDLLTRSYWRMEINLPKDKAYFTTKSFWYNATSSEQPYYHWMNLGVKAKGNLQFIFPGTKYIGHEGEYASWPRHSNGKQLDWYEQNNFGGYKSYHVFGKYTSFTGAYWHDDQLGMVRYGNHDDKAGKKIWIWGLSRQGMIWEKLLTDTDGQYVELQSGRLFNQNSEGSTYTPFKHRSMEPYNSENWKEYWYPVLKTGGFVAANNYGALNLVERNGRVVVSVSPVQQFTDSLVIYSGNQQLYAKKVNFNTLKPFVDSFPIARANEALTVLLKNAGLSYNTEPEYGNLSRPVDPIQPFDWNSSYGNFVAGKEAMDQKNFAVAEAKLLAAIGMDSSYQPALVKLAELMYRNMRYIEADGYIRRAMQFDTHDGATNYYYGLIQNALDRTIDAKDGFAVAALSYPFRSAAFTNLSAIHLKEKNHLAAEEYALKALDYSRQNMEALQLLSVIFRKQSQSAKGKKIIADILELDPLNHFSYFEKYQWDPTASNKQDFLQRIKNELPVETFLETGIWYYNKGCLEEALDIINLAPANAEVKYWLSFLQHKKPDFNSIEAGQVFPFRSETAAVMESLMNTSSDWKLKYHLALIYIDRNRKAEAYKLLKSGGQLPDFAPFYVVRSRLSPKEEILSDLQKAAELDSQWRYKKLLTEYYNDQSQYTMALPIIEKYYRQNPSDYIMGMLYAKTLLFNKKYAETDKVLAQLNIIPFEGATDGRELYREAKLMQAVQALKQKSYKKAAAFAYQSLEWPEKLGSGKPYDADIDSRLEKWILYLAQGSAKNKNLSQQLLNEITGFIPQIDNTISNFQASNALVTAWAYRELGQPEQADIWLDAQIKKFPGNKLLEWSKVKWKDEASKISAPDARNANIRILEALIQ
jgi:hypothetical protein